MILDHVSNLIKNVPNELLGEIPPSALLIVQTDEGCGLLKDLLLPEGEVEELAASVESMYVDYSTPDFEIVGFVLWCIIADEESVEPDSVFVSIKYNPTGKYIVSNHRYDYKGVEMKKPEWNLPELEECNRTIH
jgi:hypothetical protein